MPASAVNRSCGPQSRGDQPGTERAWLIKTNPVPTPTTDADTTEFGVVDHDALGYLGPPVPPVLTGGQGVPVAPRPPIAIGRHLSIGKVPYAAQGAAIDRSVSADREEAIGLQVPGRPGVSRAQQSFTCMSVAGGATHMAQP